VKDTNRPPEVKGYFALSAISGILEFGFVPALSLVNVNFRYRERFRMDAGEGELLI